MTHKLEKRKKCLECKRKLKQNVRIVKTEKKVSDWHLINRRKKNYHL
jgi:hypothetical protein